MRGAVIVGFCLPTVTVCYCNILCYLCLAVKSFVEMTKHRLSQPGSDSLFLLSENYSGRSELKKVGVTILP